MTNSPLDAVVVGAGPVGCATALRLHRSGARVLVLERQPWDRVASPRLTGVTPQVLDWMEDLGLSGLVRGATVARGCNFTLASAAGRRVRVTWSKRDSRHYFDRRAFDSGCRQLLAQLGVPYEAQVRSVEPLRDGQGRVSGIRFEPASGPSRDVAADLVVAADGRASRLAKAVDLAAPTAFRRVYQGKLVRTSVWPADSLAVMGTGVPGRSFLVFAWRDPQPRVYVELETDLVRHPNALSAQGPESHWDSALRTQPELQEVVASGPAESDAAITLEGSVKPRFHVPGLCLVGDAAAVVDPVGSSGMLIGLQGAVDLADRILAQGPRGVDFGSWERAYRSRVREIDRYAALLRATVDHPARLEWAAGILGSSPFMANYALGTMNHAQPFTDLWSPGRAWSRLRDHLHR